MGPGKGEGWGFPGEEEGEVGEEVGGGCNERRS